MPVRFRLVPPLNLLRTYVVLYDKAIEPLFKPFYAFIKNQNKGHVMDFALARTNMIKSQIKPNDVYNEDLIEALDTVYRENFIPEEKREVAYLDEDLKLTADGRYQMEPVVFAKLMQAALDGPKDYVLVIGCTMGYSVAVLSRLCGMVIGIDSYKEFTDYAEKKLARAECSNAAVFCAPMYEGYPAQGPYNLIIIEGGVGTIPNEIFLQLQDNGRLLTIERRDANKAGQAVCYLKQGDIISRHVLFDANTPYLQGFAPKTKFSF